MLTFDENGHHKPTYKHTKASQKAGPYQLHRVNSLHSSSSNRSLDNLSRGSSASSGGLLQEQRKAKSEATSPLMTGSSSFMQLNSSLPPLDLSNIGYTPYITDNLDNIFGSVSDHEPALFSAGLSASVDWSHYDGLEFASKANENFAPSSFSQPQSFGGFEQPPTLTTSTSGEVSEVEDFIPSTGDDFDIMGTFSRTSTTSTGFNLGPTQANLLGSTDLTTIDYEDFKFMKAGNKFLPSPASLPGEESSLVPTTAVTSMNNFSLVEDDPAFWMADYSSHTLPIMTESPDPNAPSFWDTQ
ncbi:putative copper fist dna binding domain-containing protein [Phaeoacremonium minimum UCRPA7]|uniref:Putative copper fist dna binding domain-containing protein n=1 Tax=Phaeoacremonium minimum (strain UCR-PA7) TaxID=1286976 RepID=R8BR65_PHAM7|nr:putative copper fist dna binding domain-containing protein [Phaeoacremonium minimum UCRPA7]EOO01795.1 putative copper fist dna binding domain-containing protein [Phaeoacremonium minimum UCRPA7]